MKHINITIGKGKLVVDVEKNVNTFCSRNNLRDDCYIEGKT